MAANVIAEAATAQVAIRLASGTAEDAKKRVREAIAAIDKRLELDFASEGYGPVYIDSDVEGESLCLSVCLPSLLTVSGFETIVVNYGTVCSNFLHIPPARKAD